MEQKDLLTDQWDRDQYSNTLLPNATASLVLGILSLVLSLILWCVFYVEFIPLGLGIAGLVLSNKDRALYTVAPGLYSRTSISNSNAGRVCSIIGIVISSLVMLLFLALLVIAGSMSYNDWNNQ